MSCIPKVFIRLSEYRTFSIRNLSKINHFNSYTCIYGKQPPLSRNKRIDVHFLDFGCKTEQCGQADYDIRILLFIHSPLAACPFIIG